MQMSLSIYTYNYFDSGYDVDCSHDANVTVMNENAAHAVVLSENTLCFRSV